MATSGFNYQGSCRDASFISDSLVGHSLGSGLIESCGVSGSSIICNVVSSSSPSTITLGLTSCPSTDPATSVWLSYIVFAFFSTFILRKTLKFFTSLLHSSELG